MDWSSLPRDVVEIIAGKITAVEDYVRFSKVCKLWRSVAEANALNLPPQVPWLLLSYNVDEDDVRHFISLADMKIRHFRLPEAGRRCLGYDHGWLVTVGLALDVKLMNPLTSEQMELPPLTTIPSVEMYHDHSALEWRMYAIPYLRDIKKKWSAREMRDEFIYKIVLSSSPVAGRRCVAIAFHSRTTRVAFCRVGEARWTGVDTGLDGMLIDARYLGGTFFVLNEYGRVAAWEIDGDGCSPVNTRSVYSFRKGPTRIARHSFVESSGELFVMRLELIHEKGKFVGGVGSGETEFRFSNVDGGSECCEVSGLGDDDVTLFLDGQRCLALHGCRSLGLSGNCVYTFHRLYSTNIEESPMQANRTISVVSVQDGAAELLPFTWEPPPRIQWRSHYYKEDLYGGQRSYIWFTPSLC